MVRIITLFIYAVSALVLQGSLGHLGVPSMFLPQLLVVLVVSLAFNEPNVFGCCVAFILGLLLDLSSAVLLGPWAGSFSVVFCGLALLSQRLFIDSWLSAGVITLFACVGANVTFSLIGSEYPALTWDYPQKVLGQGLVTAIVAPIILKLLSRRYNRLGAKFSSRGSIISPV